MGKTQSEFLVLDLHKIHCITIVVYPGKEFLLKYSLTVAHYLTYSFPAIFPLWFPVPQIPTYSFPWIPIHPVPQNTIYRFQAILSLRFLAILSPKIPRISIPQLPLTLSPRSLATLLKITTATLSPSYPATLSPKTPGATLSPTTILSLVILSFYVSLIPSTTSPRFFRCIQNWPVKLALLPHSSPPYDTVSEKFHCIKLQNLVGISNLDNNQLIFGHKEYR